MFQYSNIPFLYSNILSHLKVWLIDFKFSTWIFEYGCDQIFQAQIPHCLNCLFFSRHKHLYSPFSPKQSSSPYLQIFKLLQMASSPPSSPPPTNSPPSPTPKRQCFKRTVVNKPPSIPRGPCSGPSSYVPLATARFTPDFQRWFSSTTQVAKFQTGLADRKIVDPRWVNMPWFHEQGFLFVS
jgi:hypothetical protein